MTLISFLIFLLAFVGVGIASFRHRQSTRKDYLLADHNVSPWLVGLSAVATNNSGYMFTGVIGYTYTAGLQSIWLMLGWIAGDMVASMLTHRKLRVATEDQSTLTFAGTLSRWHGTDYKMFRLIAGLIGLIFLGIYAAAQFNAGSKALHVLFGWNINLGALIGCVVVVLYCFAGGIRASIWTDAAQAVVMVGAMAMLFFVGLDAAGGPAAALHKLQSTDRVFVEWFPADMKFGVTLGPILFVVGWFFAGVGVIGQPHIMVRFMALKEPAMMNKARLYYYGWFLIFYGLATGVGMLARLLIAGDGQFDSEIALPMMAQQLLPDVLVGVILAGIFAATISTADSLILSCSASITSDIFPGKEFTYARTKVATVFIALVALAIALYGDQSVFRLVIFSWAVLAVAFGPLLVLYAAGMKPTENEAIATCLVGVVGLFTWRHLGLNREIYEILPGFVAGFSGYALARLLRRYSRA